MTLQNCEHLNSCLEIYGTLFTFNVTRQQYSRVYRYFSAKKIVNQAFYSESRGHAHVFAIRVSQTVVTHI